MNTVRFFLLAVLSAACTTSVPDRLASDRTPLAGPCDDSDPNRCLLPWPSNRYTVADDSTRTGLRLAVDTASLPVEDRADYLNLADGFSRATGVAAAFTGPIDASSMSWDPAESLRADAPLQVINADPDHPQYGQRIPFRTEDRDATDALEEKHLIIGRPATPLAANTDHVFIITNTLQYRRAPRHVRVALGLERPKTSEAYPRCMACAHASSTRCGGSGARDGDPTLGIYHPLSRGHDTSYLQHDGHLGRLP